MSRVDTILKLTGQIADAERRDPVDEVEVRRLKQLRSDLARAEMAARGGSGPVTPSVPPPLYPAGLRARLGDYTAEVIQAWYDLGHWNYLIDVAPVPVVGTHRASLTEVEAKQEIATRTGQPAGPAYPVGASFNRRGRGGEILAVTEVGGTYQYQVRGATAPMTEAELRDALNAA
jgi:hypothetical protein